MTEWRNRITGHGELPASEFLANPLNWRVHPKFQQDALAGALNEIGWIDEVTVNRRTGRIVDGHLRVTMALRAGEHTPVPYREVDLSEEEESLALASKDPIAALAVTDDTQLAAVMQNIATGDEALIQMLEELSFGASLAASAGEGEHEGDRDLGDRQKQIKAVFYAEQLATIEAAILATGLVNRGEALAEICGAYLEKR